MSLSRREGLLTAAALITVAALALDRYALTPMLDRRAQSLADRSDALHDMEMAETLFQRQRVLNRRWRAMVQSGLGRGVEEAEGAVFHAIRAWSLESGITLSSVKPGKATAQANLVQLGLNVAATGPMRSVAKFLWLVESASLPVRIEHVQIGSRKEGADALSLQVGLSSLCMPATGADNSARREDR